MKEVRKGVKEKEGKGKGKGKEKEGKEKEERRGTEWKEGRKVKEGR